MLSCSNNLYIADEIQEIVDNSSISNPRLLAMLKSLVSDNEKIYSINTMVLQYKEGNLSENDLLISFNKYIASATSVVE